ncbi:MAG: tRNA dihydrouridine synthase DusB [Anaerolineaceae bacterium 4572_78]|nr:MAG: tRNA dihydrouridine synthase DusB [Anaerolineaceae bacterium 4572_78]
MKLETVLKPNLYIRDIPIYGDVILAPMANYSDMPYRAICREYGSAMSYTEFVAVEAIKYKIAKVLKRFVYDPQERPIVFQLFGHEIDLFLESALVAQEIGPDIIDINMGCSAKKVARRGAGAGLLKDPQKIGRLVNTLVMHLDVPVTCKIRLGWDEESLNYLEVAKIIEDNGASAIAVHGRTKVQGYKGKANWHAIAEIKQAVNIPVIGNGDVVTVEDIDSMKNQTNCDAVMIGRAAIGNPWIFAGKNITDVTFHDRVQLIYSHLDKMTDFYGEERGVILFRKHVVKYLHGLIGGAKLRAKLMRCTTSAEFVHEVVGYVEAYSCDC